MRRMSRAAVLMAGFVVACATLTGCSTATGPEPVGAITLTFLGTGSPRPSELRSGPAILVEAGPHRLIVDAGPGARDQLLKSAGWVPLLGLDLALVTHLHFDHTEDLENFMLTGWLYGRTDPFTLYGPDGMSAMAAQLEAAYTWDIGMRVLTGVPPEAGHFIAHDVTPGVIIDRDGLVVTAFDVAHMPVNPQTYVPIPYWGETLGYRIDYGGYSVVFSGDSRSLPDSPIALESMGVDVLVHEVQVPAPGDSPEAQRANLSLAVHTSPEEAGVLFAETRPRLAVYSHIIPPETTGRELADATRPFYDGPLVTAEDFMKITIGEQITIGERRGEGIQSYTDLNP